MTDEDACGSTAHFHTIIGPLLLPPGTRAIVMDQTLMALVLNTNVVVGERIMELLNRYGLVDVPDVPFAGACPWPAPTPEQRVG